MVNPFKIFSIRRDERYLAIISSIVFIALNSLLIVRHWHEFTQANYGHVGAWSLFNNRLFFSGYDPYAYMTLTQYTTYYQLDRHPLITALLYPFYLMNHWIMQTFDFNACMIIMAILVVLASVYSAIFMHRILNEVMNLKKCDSLWLTTFLFSFASIMTSAMSPDLFIFSLFLLLFSIYLFGTCMKSGRTAGRFKTGILYIITAGVTLTNGIKILLGFLFANGRKALSWKNFMFVFLFPTAILIGAYTVQYELLLKPRKEMGAIIEAKKEAKDPSLIVKNSINNKNNEKITGKAISEKPFLKLIDVESSRPNGIVEALLGESFQLHTDYLLGDIYLGRPLVVHYRSWFNYFINGIIVFVFVLGIIVGWHNNIIKMLLSWFAVDILIHIILGFGINEAYINGTHWMFFIPIAIACLYKKACSQSLFALRLLIGGLTGYLWIYNCSLIVSYLV